MHVVDGQRGALSLSSAFVRPQQSRRAPRFNDGNGALLPTLRIENLSTRHFGPVELSIGAGCCVCITGASGTGKTMLLRAVADLDPHEGSVFLDDVECRAFSGPDWRRRVGMLPSESQWWYDRVTDHFMDVEPLWLKALGFTSGVLDGEVARLSSGERQRLALLRLLCGHPAALLLDEPTANLDPESAAHAERLILSYAESRGAPVIWVSHNPEQVRRLADRHYRLIEGRLQEQSST